MTGYSRVYAVAAEQLRHSSDDLVLMSVAQYLAIEAVTVTLPGVDRRYSRPCSPCADVQALIS